MTVYVDDMFMKATVPNGGRTVTGEWCHMQADTREELDAMADKIGLRRSWIQYPYDDVKRHYDVTRPRRAAAVAAGAVEVGMLDLARMRAKWRAARRAAQSTGPCGVPHPYAGRPCSRPAGHPASEGHGNDQVAWLATEPTEQEGER